jgi:NAD dependent epimerase/dehydratase family enzyme
MEPMGAPRRNGKPIRRGRFFLPGAGESVMGLVSIVDAAEALVTACERSIFGLFNVVDDRPLSWRVMVATIAAHFERRPPPRVPMWTARLAKGEDIARWVTANLFVSNARAQAAGFRLRYPNLEAGLSSLVLREAV